MRKESIGGAQILPFIPEYSTLIICQEKLQIYWYEVDFCQSRYNFKGQNNGSNACTLIAVLAAANCYSLQMKIGHPSKELEENFTVIIACAIIDGNEFHSRLRQHSSSPEDCQLTVPEAIKHCGNRGNGIKEWVALIDTHQHTSAKGAALAIVDLGNLRCMCTWLTHIVLKYYHSVPNLYELSFLYFPKKT